MPPPHLKLMGLLAKYPLKSPVLMRFATPDPGKKYTKAQLQHIVATLNTPGIPRAWIDYQFQRIFGWKKDRGLYKMRPIADRNPQFKYLGAENIPLLTRQHVIRFYQRRDKDRNAHHPPWGRSVIYDLQKEGLTAREIADLLDMTLSAVECILYRDRKSIFAPYKHGNIKNLVQFRK